VRNYHKQFVEKKSRRDVRDDELEEEEEEEEEEGIMAT
jgi:hypothetical protein